MPDFYPVFNLSSTPHGIVFGQEEYVQLPPREWSVVPARIAKSYCANESSLLVDFGPTSITTAMCPNAVHGRRQLTFASPIDVVTGYGNASEKLILEFLDKPNLDLSLVRTGYWTFDAIDPRVKECAQQSLQALEVPAISTAEPVVSDDGAWVRPFAQRPKFPSRWGIGLTIPPEIRKLSSPRKLIYTMWECNVIPQRENYLLTGRQEHMPEHWHKDVNAWPEWVNFYADILAVPSGEMKRVFEKSGIQREAHVIPLGVHGDVYKYEPRTRIRRSLRWIGNGTHPVGALWEQREKFTMLVYGELSARKGIPEILTDVVWPVLDKHEDWQLVVKTRGNNRSLLASIHDDRVKVICADYTPEQMAGLCRYADCGIALSRYEGFGMPFREMMASGLPVIVSDCSGHIEDCDPDYNYPVDCPEMVEAGSIYGFWYEPNWEQAQVSLRKEYESWKARGGVQSPMGERAAQWIRQRRQWSQTADMLLGLIESHESKR